MTTKAISSQPTAENHTDDGSALPQAFTIGPTPTPTVKLLPARENAMQEAHYRGLIVWANIAAEMNLTTHIRRDGNGRLTVIIDGWVLEGLH